VTEIFPLGEKSDLNLSCNVPPKTGNLGKEVSETFSQFFLQEHWDSASQVWEALVPILPVVLPHLDWWTRRENVLTGVALLHPVPSLTLYTDSSD
jgi:hypothetical protein